MKRYEHIDMVPTKAAQENARRALEVRQTKPESERGMTAVGIARARDIANGVSLSPETWRRVKAYFDRHESDKSGETWDEQGKGWQAWMGWGGDENWATARRIVEQMDAADRDAEARGWTAPAITEFRAEDAPARDDGMTPGKPLRVITSGPLHARVSGEAVRALTRDDLQAMAAFISARAESDPVVWRLTHAWAEDRAKSADEVLPLGRVVEAWVEDDDDRAYLVVRSLWTAYGVDVLTRGRGALWPSLEWVHAPAHDRDTGARVGPLLPIGIAVTPQPLYAPDRLSAVSLNGEFPPPEGMTGAEPQGADMSEELMALIQRLDALEARLGALESAPDSDSPEDEGEAEMAGYKPDEMRSELAGLKAAVKAAATAEQQRHDADAKALAELRSEVAELQAAKQAAEFRSEFADYLAAGKAEAHERDTFMDAKREQAAGRPAFFAAVFGSRAEGQFRSERATVSEGKAEGRPADPLAGARGFFEARGEKFDRSNPNYADLLVAYSKEASK